MRSFVKGVVATVAACAAIGTLAGTASAGTLRPGDTAYGRGEHASQSVAYYYAQEAARLQCASNEIVRWTGRNSWFTPATGRWTVDLWVHCG